MKVSELSSRTRNELNAILSGTADKNKVIQQYRKSFTKEYSGLSKVERYKFLAIVNQKHYELPLITISRYRHLYYVRLLEFYNRAHNTSFVGFASSALERYNREKLYGSREFENLTDVSMNEISKNFNLKLLLQTRKLPQDRFEDMCDLAAIMNIGFGRFFVSAIISGYKIQPQHEKLFYPFIIYHNSEKIESWIKNKIRIGDLEKQIALENNYMIDGVRYWNSYHRKVYETKKIFLKEGFKVIERN